MAKKKTRVILSNNEEFIPATLEQKSQIEHRLASIRELNEEFVGIIATAFSPFFILHGGMFLLMKEQNIFSFVANRYKKAMVAEGLREMFSQGYLKLADHATGRSNVITFGNDVYEEYANSPDPDGYLIALYNMLQQAENNHKGSPHALTTSKHYYPSHAVSFINQISQVVGEMEATHFLSIGLALLSPVLYYLTLPPVVKSLGKSLSDYQLRADIADNEGLISTKEADAIISSLNSKDSSIKTRFYGSAASINLIAFTLLAISATMVSEGGEISYEMLAFLTSIFVSQLRAGYLVVKKRQAETRFLANLDASVKLFNEALTDTGGKCYSHKGHSLTDSFFIFKANSSYKTLSATIVNQVVKGILLKNGISITDFSSRKHTFAVKTLTAAQVKSIKSQVMNYLDALVAIKKLGIQIAYFFNNANFIRTTYIEKDLPKASFLVEKVLTEDEFNQLKNIFTKCQVQKFENGISISGNVPAKDYPPRPSKVALAGVANTSATVSIAKSEGATTRKITDKKRLLSQPTPAIAPIPRPGPVSLVEYKWNSGTFKSNEAGRIKPINHPFFRKHFVRFDIPTDYFPTIDMYEKIRNKVEEGHMATSQQGQQGLQMRLEWARDVTKPKHDWFLSKIRCKTLGDTGDVRVYGEEEKNAEGAVLYKFRGIDLSAH